MAYFRFRFALQRARGYGAPARFLVHGITPYSVALTSITVHTECTPGLQCIHHVLAKIDLQNILQRAFQRSNFQKFPRFARFVLRSAPENGFAQTLKGQTEKNSKILQKKFLLKNRENPDLIFLSPSW